MQIVALFIIALCIHACKEDAQEKEVEFELNKPEIVDLENVGLHLGGGLYILKRFNEYVYWGKPRWEIEILDCYDCLIDTMAPTEHVVKYRQGGLCFYNDCSIEPENSFTMLMKVPMNFIDAKKYSTFNIFASKYNDSTTLYKHVKRTNYFATADEHEEVLAIKNKKTDSCKLCSLGEYLATLNKAIIREKEESGKDTIIFLKRDGKSWEEFFSIAMPLEIKDEDFSEYCNSKFCSTKDFLNPLYQFNCLYGVELKDIECYFHRPRRNPSDDDGKYIPKCLSKLEELSKKYGIVLMHSGAFPAGDCDLGNWRYLKIDSLSKEHYEKLKDLVTPPDTISSGS